jgi:Terminase large subunit, T4likevirus-type, N-terminal
VPRKKIVDAVETKPYLNADGTLNFDKIFRFQAKQTELLRNVMRNGKVYVQPAAEQCLSTGGIRSGKTCGWLMYFVMHYCLQWNNCNLLVLRRTFKELESGAISDFKTFMPPELYDYDQTKHVATLKNGSRIVFGHCQNNKDRDIEQYLGQAYPAILVDECGQFSPDAWMMLYSRNIVNAGCERDEAGNLPIPAIVGCTNPLGPHYEYYRTLFVQQEPWNPGEEAKRDPVDGTWWVQESGEWVKIYDPSKYAYQRSTVMDNPELLARDPGIIARLMSMPKAKRDKVLYGYDGSVEGQYFDCFDPSYHVINLREDPEAIVWQEYQPVWAGEDWGMQHANATYLFTKAMVKDSVGENYRLKTVCFAELVVTGGKTMDELASLIKAKCHLPDGRAVKLNAIYFSHEKFNRQMDNRTPADEYSRALKLVGLPPVTSATRDRIGSASLMYNAIKKGELVILDTCKEIILAIPSLMRNPDLLDDVLKVDAKGDDCYDGFRYGLYGHLAARKKPEAQAEKERVDKLKKTDPLAAHFLKMKLDAEAANKSSSFTPPEQPVWMGKQDQG